MGIGAFFLLVIVVVVLVVLGGGLYAVTMWLRHRQLSPQGDMVEGDRMDRQRPQHVEVDNQQRARFAGTR